MTEHKVTMESTLKVLLEQKKYSTLKDILVTMNPSDVADRGCFACCPRSRRRRPLSRCSRNSRSF